MEIAQGFFLQLPPPQTSDCGLHSTFLVKKPSNSRPSSYSNNGNPFFFVGRRERISRRRRADFSYFSPVSVGPVGAACCSVDVEDEDRCQRSFLRRRNLLLGLVAAESVSLCFQDSTSFDNSGTWRVDAAHAAEDENKAAEKESKAASSSEALDVKKWKRFFGPGYDLRIPPNYIDVTDETAPAPSTATAFKERAGTNPFAMRFVSEDREAQLSVIVRPSNSLKLSFFEAQDISDFGTPEEAASILVPEGAKILALGKVAFSETRSSRFCLDPSSLLGGADKDGECTITVARNYYLYEFYTQGQHVTISAAANSGRVYVMGATAPQSKWKELGAPLRAATRSFALSS